ncbi:hypothetical protein LTR78_005864 [Recurvomyces mirabilis]|uniref:Uncharacterized protein n=1 Tax=Recurvomyces mirabilis TaxID=574656 RepID=A0AAE1C1E5_9PEZI|nr:hypothetical protein LTR78_005864 [Recurvomyces mirabilis]KAK5154245.1 hypothetical protein LTS14_006930 [Recurvomyces mirabilis]
MGHDHFIVNEHKANDFVYLHMGHDFIVNEHKANDFVHLHMGHDFIVNEYKANDFVHLHMGHDYIHEANYLICYFHHQILYFFHPDSYNLFQV